MTPGIAAAVSVPAVAFGILVCCSVPSVADGGVFELALKMAERARDACIAKGFAPTVSFVGIDGQPVVVLRSDGSPIHSIQNSFNKAYTIMTLGPLERVERMTDLAAKYSQMPAVGHALARDPLPHISFSTGSVLVRANGRVVGGLGVSGSETGAIDESCAQAGLDGAH